MKLLLDTHALIWWFTGNTRLPIACRRAIEDPTKRKFVSAVLAWEIATKYRIGKLEDAGRLAQDLQGVMVGQGFEELPITVEDGIRAGTFPLYHRDPFDRMLIAQALGRNLVLVSVESLFDRYGVRRLW